MELRHLRYFVAIVDHGSFTRAAIRANVTQPALSRQIRDLEEELGRALFVRNSSGASLTAAGRALLPQARKLLSQAAALVDRVREVPGEESPRLKIAHSCAFDSEFIAPLLRPGRGLIVELFEMRPGEAFAALRENKANAIVAVCPLRPRFVAGLTGWDLWRIAPMAALPARHRLARRRGIRLEELAAERWAMWEEKMFPGYTDNFVAECRRAGFQPNIVQRVASLGAIFPHVMAGDFMSFTAAVARQLPHPGVALVPLVWPVERRPVVRLFCRSNDKYKALFEELAATIAKKAIGRAG